MRSKYGDYFGITVAGYPGQTFSSFVDVLSNKFVLQMI